MKSAHLKNKKKKKKNKRFSATKIIHAAQTARKWVKYNLT